ncbi:MAG: pyridoxamine 5'-phosphate oxidase family protein [Parvibaculaceae bacterium]
MTATPGWPHEMSPFHEGEQAMQDRAGVRERAEGLARRVIRDYMPDEHREFYGSLPFLLLGSVTEGGLPQASLVAGRPGFVGSPQPTRLTVNAALLPGDPLKGNLTEGMLLGVLGIDPATRRRNRMAGTVVDVKENCFSIDVTQAFGNCPKFIQARDVAYEERRVAGVTPVHASSLPASAQKLISHADTFFIASAYTNSSNVHANGADVSHRGGKPGFVRIEDDRTILFPDFSGNNHFNTLGNIHLNPWVGLLFADFDKGDLLHLSGRAEIIWEGALLETFEGAERLVRIRLDHTVSTPGVLPLNFRFNEYSPYLARTGGWPAP